MLPYLLLSRPALPAIPAFPSPAVLITASSKPFLFALAVEEISAAVLESIENITDFWYTAQVADHQAETVTTAMDVGNEWFDFLAAALDTSK